MVTHCTLLPPHHHGQLLSASILGQAPPEPGHLPLNLPALAGLQSWRAFPKSLFSPPLPLFLPSPHGTVPCPLWPVPCLSHSPNSSHNKPEALSYRQPLPASTVNTVPSLPSPVPSSSTCRSSLLYLHPKLALPQNPRASTHEERYSLAHPTERWVPVGDPA